MIATLAKALLSVAGRAAYGALESEIRGGIESVRGSAQGLIGGGSAAEAEPIEIDGSVAPFVVAGLVASVAAVALVPKWRNAALDFNDGALRKWGQRTTNWFSAQDWARGAGSAMGRVVAQPN